MAKLDPRRVDYPDQERFPGAYVVLPAEWLGEHFVRRDAAVRASVRFNSNQVTLAACSLVLADDWDGIPGITGDDPTAWDFGKTPAELLVWLERTVYNDFARVYAIPKAWPSPSSDGSTGTETASTTGGSAPTS